MKFYGREQEIEALRWQFQRAQETKVARMAVVTGRRRIGKTTLIRKAFEASVFPFIYYFVTSSSNEEEMAQLLVAQASRCLDIKYPPAITKVADAIGWLLEMSHSKPLVFVLDECQQLDSWPNFWSELQRTWDLGKSGAQALFVLSGSVQTAIERIFGNSSEPLFGRNDQMMIVRPFSTSLVGKIFEDCSPSGIVPSDLLLFYAITGGVARYVELLVDAEATTQEKLLTFLFSERGTTLQKEGDTLLANEFRLSAPLYRTILRRLAAGRSKRTELQAGVATDISPYLARLENLYGLVGRVQPFEEPSEKRKTRYRVTDPYLRFWLRFLSGDDIEAQIELQQWPGLIQRTTQALPTYLGRSLEDWYRQRFLELSGLSPVGAWWDRRGENEIDLIALDENRKRIVFAEIKSQTSKLDEVKLRRKSEAFFDVHRDYRSWKQVFLGLTPHQMLDTPLGSLRKEHSS